MRWFDSGLARELLGEAPSHKSRSRAPAGRVGLFPFMTSLVYDAPKASTAQKRSNSRIRNT
jgi:hypothetical protein